MNGEVSKQIHRRISFVGEDELKQGQEIHEDGLNGNKVYLRLSTRQVSLNSSTKGAASLTTSLKSSGVRACIL